MESDKGVSENGVYPQMATLLDESMDVGALYIF